MPALNWRSGLARALPPLIPPLILLATIATHAVNVPRWDDFGVIPFVVHLRDGTLKFDDFWAQHNEHRIAAVKLILAPLMLATDFDVRAMMYAGFALQLLALAFLSSLIGRTVRAIDPPLAGVLAFVIALLMFSPAQDEVWLWGLPSLQWHLCNLTAAAGVWLVIRRPRPRLAFAACFLLTLAGMLAVASGIVLWGVVLVVIVTEGIAERRRKRVRRVCLNEHFAVFRVIRCGGAHRPAATGGRTPDSAARSRTADRKVTAVIDPKPGTR